MNDVKYKLIDTQLYDYSYIEQKLTRQSAEGWHLEKIGSLAWKFRRGEPKQVRYAVTYAPSASAFNSRLTEQEEDLTDLCAQAGWVRVGTMAQLHVYRSDDPNATPLETDEGERLKNIRRTMGKHFFPMMALMIFLFLMQFYMHLHNTVYAPARSFSSPMLTTALAVTLFAAAQYAILALNGALWLRRARLAVEGGEPIPVNRFYRGFRWVVWVFLILYLIALMRTIGLGFLAGVLGITAAVILGTVVCINLCKKLNAPKWVNMAAPLVLNLVVISILTPLLVFNLDGITANRDLPPAEDLPVTLTQLTGETGTRRLVLEESSTFLCSYGHYQDTGSDDNSLTYTIVDVKCPLLYDTLLDEQEDEFLIATHYTADPEVVLPAEQFGAQYARHAQTALRDHWLICWDTRIVHIKSTWPLTEEQIAILADILKPQ